MKSKLVLLILISTFSFAVKAQNPYNDALFLKGSLTDSKDLTKGVIPLNATVRSILARYFVEKVPVSDAGQGAIDSFFIKNPFFRNPADQSKSIFVVTGAAAVGPIISRALSGIGGIRVTNFADGLAKFLVKRFKDELTIAFFQKFKDAISQSPEFQTLFPQSFQVIMTIDKDIYQFSIYLNTLREAFIKDLQNLYINFKSAAELPSFQNYFNDHPEIKTIIINAFYFIDQYSRGAHPGEVIANYDADGNLFFADTTLQLNVRSSVKVLQLISFSVRSQSDLNYWVPADSVRLLLQDPVGLDLYMGLLYQKALIDQPEKNYTFHTASGDIAFFELLGKAYGVVGKLNEYKKYIEDIVYYAQHINDVIAALKKDKPDVDYIDSYNLYNSAADIMKKSLQINSLPSVNIEAGLKEKTISFAGKWIGIAHLVGELYVDIRAKNYSSAVIDVANLIDSIGNSQHVKLKEDILKYGSFAAAIAQSKNSDDVAAAIESVALPAGSYSVKRESSTNISVNAYVGGYGGVEYMPALERDKSAFTAGVTAPVGLAFSWKLKHFLDGKKPGGKSFTIFVPLIDIGALASFRLNDDQTNIAADIELKNIIAPGLYFYLGLGKCPISIGAGAQLGPQLRGVSEGTPTIDTKNIYIRYGLTIAVDIPLLNIHTTK